MSQAGSGISQQNLEPVVAKIDMKVEVVVIPVSDLERAKSGKELPQ